MITREDLRQLAQVESPEGSAVSFYFQPRTPQNRSHKEEAILVKDLVRDALRAAERSGANGRVRADLDRIVEMAEHLHGNHARAKAVFACSSEGVWREFDLPSQLRETQVYVNNRFHLRPLAPIAAAPPRCGIALVDRERARLFTLWLGEVTEHTGMFDALPRIGRSDGFAGYDAGHLERKYENEAMRHFKAVGERLQDAQKKQGCGAFILGCREEVWPEFEPHLHAYTRQKLLGRFSIDPVTASAEQVQEKAQRILAEHEVGRREVMISEVLGEAQRNGRGSLGLRHVLNSLERGEVHSLLLGENFSAQAVECRNCGHLDTRLVHQCAVCGQETRELSDVADAILVRAIAASIELIYVRDNPAFDKAGGIGALLRFRADQNTAERLAGVTRRNLPSSI